MGSSSKDVKPESQEFLLICNNSSHQLYYFFALQRKRLNISKNDGAR